MKTKICSKCKQELEISQFRWRNKTQGTLHSQCKNCGEKRPYLMEFHHINAEDKINNIAHMIKSASKETLIAELDKCLVLCANCHREFHYLEKKNSITLDEYLGR